MQYGRAGGVLWRDLGDEILIVRTDGDAHFLLQRFARHLWLDLQNLLDKGPVDWPSLLCKLQTHVDGLDAAATRETLEFLAELVHARLITTASA